MYHFQLLILRISVPDAACTAPLMHQYCTGSELLTCVLESDRLTTDSTYECIYYMRNSSSPPLVETWLQYDL